MKTWLPLEPIQHAIQIEPLLLVAFMAVIGWPIYKILLKKMPTHRHQNLRKLFRNLLGHGAFAAALLLTFWGMESSTFNTAAFLRTEAIVGLFAVVWCCVVFVKACRILAFEYLFFTNMKTGVPVLIVNILALLLSAILFVWVLNAIFGFRLAPLLTTSAAFSIVLGLALQETLGNLVAGVALQLDKPYGIGDWIEVASSNHTWVGQVREITWRAVNLIGILDETITIPNRVVAQAEISNFSGRERPFLRRQLFRFPHSVSMAQLRPLLLEAVHGTPGLRPVPEPLVLLSDTRESWLEVKVVYSIYDFGAQFLINDQINTRILEKLRTAGIELATDRLDLTKN